MDDKQKKINEARKIVDFFGTPKSVIILYFIGAILFIVFRVDETAPWAFFVLFLALFAIYLITANIRRALMSEIEDDYDDWISGQRGT